MAGQVDILHYFEALANGAATGTFFFDACAGNEGDSYPRVTYGQARLRAASLARYLLEKRGIIRGSSLVVDMGSCPEFVYLLLAAAYNNYTLIALNTRLTSVEKSARVSDVKRALKQDACTTLTRNEVVRAIEAATPERPEASESEAADVERWAAEAAETFDPACRAVVMFTSGTSGKAKAAALSWDNLSGAARASNETLNTRGVGMWQLALPMFHVGGLQVVVRSLLNSNPFILYGAFDPARTLADARKYTVTHISVVDKMLSDLLQVDNPIDPQVPVYQCLLLGGAAPNRSLLQQAVEAGACVYSSYGMTETSSQIASCPVGASFDGGLRLLPGYTALVLDPDQTGLGKLAVKGPGVFGGYLNTQAVFTADGYFITGDSARVNGDTISVAERTKDMFVSGGENIYPEEIRSKLLGVPGVTEAYVFGATDATWGRRPVAFVEAAHLATQPDFDAFEFARQVHTSLSTRLAKIYLPRQIIALPSFPRSGLGKVDRAELDAAYACCIEIARVDVWRIKQPLVNATRTAKTNLKERESLLVRVTDTLGRTGIAEGVAFSTDWYLPETVEEDCAALRKLAPALIGRALLHPRQASALLDAAVGEDAFPLAKAALEPALWDLFGKLTHCSVRELIGGRSAVTEPGAKNPVPEGFVHGGAVVGILTLKDTVSAVQAAVDAGYTRVKLKIRPGHDVETVAAVREAFPQLTLMLDANQSYTEDQVPLLRQLDAFGIACLEEPLDPDNVPTVGPRGIFDRLERLQAELATPICLDESWSTADQLEDALSHTGLRCYALKIAKFGGVTPALEFYRRARSAGLTLWMGGMYDTGVSKRLHAAFATLPGINLPGDISDTARYFETDVCVPPFVLEAGALEVNPHGYEYGLGCTLDLEAVERLAVEHIVFP